MTLQESRLDKANETGASESGSTKKPILKLAKLSALKKPLSRENDEFFTLKTPCEIPKTKNSAPISRTNSFAILDDNQNVATDTEIGNSKAETKILISQKIQVTKE